jgi:hypothetical protein
MGKRNKMNHSVIILGIAFFLSGCLGGGGILGCGPAYNEMYGGYDYDFSTIDVEEDNSLNVTVHMLKSGGGMIEERNDLEQEQTVWVDLTIQFADGSTKKITTQTSDWQVYGDGSNGSYWSTNLVFSGPAGTCDLGCEKIRFNGGYEEGAIYYDHTCASSPWISVD